jgi:8-oxo-dGTP pyrophosphatase MutT (NUDIX family)
MTEPAIPRPAASLLILRPAQDTQVLMGMRGAGHKFMPNRLVFPGGAVDDEDHSAPVGSPLHPRVLSRIARGAEGSLAHAIGVAAARELHEETGLTLGQPPSLHGLDYLCRAITPPNSPIRFDARFLIVDEAHVSGTLEGSGELENLRWIGVEDVLATDIPYPTRGVLILLRKWLAKSVDERAADILVPTYRIKGWDPE